MGRHFEKKQRHSYLSAKYSGQTLGLILDGRVWLGQTAEQLVDSIGRPHGVDHKTMKTIRREIWKYGHRGSNRYRVRVTLDFGRVVSWDDKS